MAKQPPVTIVRFARPIEDGSRVVDAVTIRGDTGPTQLPIGRVGENAEIDMLAVQRVIASRTGLSEVAVSAASPAWISSASILRCSSLSRRGANNRDITMPTT
jgi:hypothetical protein